jgi:methylenetetrahydrofolate reductase (NADPH)
MQSLNRILALCGANIPLKLYLELQEADRAGGDEAVRRKGIEIARRQINELLDLGAPGIHLYSLNNADVCLDILSGLPTFEG